MSQVRLMAARMLLAALITLQAGVLPIIWIQNEEHNARYAILTLVICSAMVLTVHTAWRTRVMFGGEKAIALPFREEDEGEGQRQGRGLEGEWEEADGDVSEGRGPGGEEMGGVR